MGRFGCMMGRFGQCNGPFWTTFLEIKILGAVLVGAVLAMGRFGIDPFNPLMGTGNYSATSTNLKPAQAPLRCTSVNIKYIAEYPVSYC